LRSGTRCLPDRTRHSALRISKPVTPRFSVFHSSQPPLESLRWMRRVSSFCRSELAQVYSPVISRSLWPAIFDASSRLTTHWCDGVTRVTRKSLRNATRGRYSKNFRNRCHTLSHGPILSHGCGYSSCAVLNRIPSHTRICLVSRPPSGLARSCFLPSFCSRSSKIPFETGCLSPLASAHDE
jgi:hypothetical protein